MEAVGGARPCAPVEVGESSFATAASELEVLLGQSFAGRTPTVTYLGVSPPVRSGAANPCAHDRSWTRSAYSASHSNLQALRELDSTGESFLRAGPRHAPGRLGGSAGSMAVDAAALVLVSPAEFAPSVLAQAAAAADGGADGCGCGRPAAAEAAQALLLRSGRSSVSCVGEAGTAGRAAAGAAGCEDAEESASDAGSEATVAAAAAAAAPPSVLAPATAVLCAAAPPAASALRARLLGASAVAPAPSVLTGAAITADVPRIAAARPPAAPRASKPQAAVLEPFACQTLYYA